MKTAIPLSPEIHRSLTIYASKEGVSVEMLANAILDFSLGEMASGTIRSAGRPEGDSSHHAPPSLSGVEESSDHGCVTPGDSSMC